MNLCTLTFHFFKLNNDIGNDMIVDFAGKEIKKKKLPLRQKK
jgi:hypothetical protein